jgi:galactokinase
VKDSLVQQFRAAFGAEPEIIARAPGRIEFVGNHTDYNGGPVLGAAIDRSIWVGLRRRADASWRLAAPGRPTVTATDPAKRREGSESWVNYPLGARWALAKRGIVSEHGFDFMAVSDLPPGAGLSSSAALELSTLLALTKAAGAELGRAELAMAGRDAENNFVGVPCGILDQGVSAFGKRHHLVRIDCRGPVFSLEPLPAAARFWIFNTHQKHALVDSLYSKRHAECMEAAERLKARYPQAQQLADITPEMLEAAADLLPEVLLRRARHIVQECDRVNRSATLLAAGDLAAVGQLLFASHESSRANFENSVPELDFLVDTLRGKPGVFGARLTGGGFGGAALALTDGSFDSAESVADAYAAKFGERPDVLPCQTGDGAELL